MSNSWKTQFRELFDAGAQRRKEGCNEPGAMFESAELDFLESIGCSAQEMFDFCDDYVGWDDVIYEHVEALQAVRYEYFVQELGSQSASYCMEMSEFPPKDADVEGIAWLPRLIVKARAKLAGQLPADLMYG